MHLANYPTHHLGCSQSKADGDAALSGAIMQPDGCRHRQTDAAPHRYCQYHAAPSGEPARRSTIIEPANIPSGMQRHRQTIAGTSGMQHHLEPQQSKGVVYHQSNTTPIMNIVCTQNLGTKSPLLYARTRLQPLRQILLYQFK